MAFKIKLQKGFLTAAAFILSLLPSLASASTFTIVMPADISLGSIDKYCASPVRTFLAINQTSMHTDITSRVKLVSKNTFTSNNYDISVTMDNAKAGGCKFKLSTGLISYSGSVSSMQQTTSSGIVQAFKVEVPFLPRALANLLKTKLQGKVDVLSNLLRNGELSKFQGNFDKPLEDLITTFISTGQTQRPEQPKDKTITTYTFEGEYIGVLSFVIFLALFALFLGFPISIIVSLIRDR